MSPQCSTTGEEIVAETCWTGRTDIRNTLRVPLTTIIPAGRSISLLQTKPRSLTETVPWWLTSRNKFARAKHSFSWGPVRKIMPGFYPLFKKKFCRPLLYCIYIYIYSWKTDSPFQSSLNDSSDVQKSIYIVQKIGGSSTFWGCVRIIIGRKLFSGQRNVICCFVASD